VAGTRIVLGGLLAAGVYPATIVDLSVFIYLASRPLLPRNQFNLYSIIMASLSLESRAESNSTEQDMFNILNDYLQPSSTTPPSEAAQAIHALTPKAGSTQEENNDLENFLWSSWGAVIEIAKQIPHNHPSQDRLVALIHALTELPPTTVSIWSVSV
jgi:hypothetical protein